VVFSPGLEIILEVSSYSTSRPGWPTPARLKNAVQHSRPKWGGRGQATDGYPLPLARWTVRTLTWVSFAHGRGRTHPGACIRSRSRPRLHQAGRSVRTRNPPGPRDQPGWQRALHGFGGRRNVGRDPTGRRRRPAQPRQARRRAIVQRISQSGGQAWPPSSTVTATNRQFPRSQYDSRSTAALGRRWGYW
jgi:hypothetical protein